MFKVNRGTLLLINYISAGDPYQRKYDNEDSLFVKYVNQLRFNSIAFSVCIRL